MFCFFKNKKKIRQLDLSYIQRHCGITATVFREVGSTNEIVKAYGRQEAPAYTTVVAESQTAGKGRGDHSFFSPLGTGVYLSILLRPSDPSWKPADITAAAGVAACETVEALCKKECAIKWMNDVYLDGKKVAGILAESSFSASGSFVVVGVGFNLTAPDGGFPEAFASRATSVFGEEEIGNKRERAAVLFFQRLEARMRADGEGTYRAYKKRLFVMGKRVTYEGRAATVTDLAPDYRLEITFDNGEKKLLDSGEISLAQT